MKQFKRLSMVQRLMVAFLVLSLIPISSLFLTVYRTYTSFNHEIGKRFESQALESLEKIDRNLFERYGDVQAFGVNTVLSDKTSWYQVGSGSNKIAEVMNQYMGLYGCYHLMIAVDREGRVIAVNDKNVTGKPIATGYLYQQNFKNADWFRSALTEKGLDTPTLKGTWVDDLYVDADVKKVYGNDGLAIGFSAPIRDASGNVIGVWTNKASFAIVDQIFVEAYKNAFKGHGFDGAELTLLDSRGCILLDYDPVGSGSEEVKHDMSVILRFNLVDKGVEAAKRATAGESGVMKSHHERNGIEQIAVYSHSDGALGFAGLGWSMLVRLDPKDVNHIINDILWSTYVTVAICVGIVMFAAYYIAKSMVRPIELGNEEIAHISHEVSGAVVQLTSASTTLAEGANEQAAALEETSASLEELASMTKRNAENALGAKDLASQARQSVDKGIDEMKSLQTAMRDIQNSGQNISKIIKTIDEIAFQTNILALNAAVEAARAGEHGLGFAVVADEVRNLAQRSASAAKETAVLIEGAVQSTQQGAQLGDRVAKDLEEIVEHVRKVDSLVAEIAMASDEQSKGVGQISSAVAEMDKVTQASAATSEETAASARQLSAQVDSLSAVVEGFSQIVEGRSKGAQHSVAVSQVSGSAASAPHRSQATHALPSPESRGAHGGSPAKKRSSADDSFFVDHH